MGHITTLDMTDQVCGPKVCPLQVGTTLVYVDGNHLTDAYAMSQSPLISKFVSRLEAGRP